MASHHEKGEEFYVKFRFTQGVKQMQQTQPLIFWNFHSGR